MASANVNSAQAWGGLFEAGVNAWQGFRQQKAANKWYKALAKQEELDAKAEAEALMQAADERLVAYHARAGELRLDATRMTEATEDQADEIRAQGNAYISSIRANAAASGIESSGSPLEMMAHINEVTEYQAWEKIKEGRIRADAMIHEASQMEAQGSREKAAAQSGAATTLLTSKWKQQELLSRRKSPWAGVGSVLSETKGLNRDQWETIMGDIGLNKPKKTTPKASNDIGIANFGAYWG